MKYKVTTAPPVEPLTRQEAKEHCRIELDFNEDNALVDSLVKGARQWAENFLQRAIIEQTVTLKRSGFSDWMALPLTNLISVESVKYLDADGAEQTLSTDVYGVDTFSDIGAVYRKDGQSWPTVAIDPLAVTITYKAGYAPDASSPPDYRANVPEDIRRGMLLLVGHLYENRETSIVGTTASPLPFGADALLRPYRRLGV